MRGVGCEEGTRFSDLQLTVPIMQPGKKGAGGSIVSVPRPQRIRLHLGRETDFTIQRNHKRAERDRPRGPHEGHRRIDAFTPRADYLAANSASNLCATKAPPPSLTLVAFETARIREECTPFLKWLNGGQTREEKRHGRQRVYTYTRMNVLQLI